MAIKKGKQSVEFEKKIGIKAVASTVGKKEGEGPLGDKFDRIVKESMAGEDSWEKAESKLVRDNMSLAIKKADLSENDIDYVVSGDLLNQSSGSTFGLRGLDISYFGIYGACSTYGEGLSIGSALIEAGMGKNVLIGASSHFCAAEKQFRFPLELGNQRPLTSTWTVTGHGAAILTEDKKESALPFVRGITTGKIVDFGVKDANNMGAAMAPAAAQVILSNFLDFGVDNSYYDLIATGDLGYVGKELVLELVKKGGVDISKNYTDCGIEIFDREKQDTHSGGSGCACSAVTFNALFYPKLKSGEMKRILFIPTGALLNSTSCQQGETIPSIAHGVVIESSKA